MNPSVFFLFLLSFLLATAPATSATLGDYRTKASGNWNQTTVWQYYNGSAWVNATTTPTYVDNNIDILSGHTVNVTSALTIDQTDVAGILNVNAGISLTINDGSSTDLSVSNLVNVYGTLISKGSVASSPEELVFKGGSTYKHNQNGGSVPDATWNDDSYCEITGITSSGSLLNTDQSFSHFTWNCTSQTSECNLAGNLETIRGNLYMNSTGSAGKLKLAESADYTLTITGNWIHAGGTLNMGGGSSYALILLHGNFSMSAGKITEGNASGYYAKIVFTKAGLQTFTKSSGTLENSIDFEVVSGATLDMGDQVADGSLGQFSVNSGSTLRTSHAQGIAVTGSSGCIQTASRYFSLAANYSFNRNGAQSTGNGIPSPLNGKITIGSTANATSLTLTNGSLTINGSLVLVSNSLSNSSITTGTVLYGPAGTLEYQGLSAQTTSLKEWPSSSGPVNVMINNGSGVTLAHDRTIGGTLTLASGSFAIGAHTLTLNGTLTRTAGSLMGGSGSNITIGGSSVTALDLPEVTLGNLVLNRPGGVRLTGTVTLAGAMVMTNGAVTLMTSMVLVYLPGSRLKYNSSAAQTTSLAEFPASGGPPSLEIDKAGGSTLSLSFNRTLEENLLLTNGNCSIGNHTLTLNGLIVKSIGELIGGSTSNLSFTGNGDATTLPTVNLNQLTIQRPAGITLGGSCTIFGTLSLVDGPFIISNTGMLYLMGNPITGNPANCHADPGGGLYIGGIVPGHTVPPGITTLGMLTIDNPSGVELLAPLQVENMLQVFRPFRMNDHTLSGPGQVMILPGAHLITQHPDGIAGNIQLTGPFMIDGEVDYTFNGSTDQTTSFLPTNPPETIRNLEISNAFPANVLLDSDITVNGLLVIKHGSTLVIPADRVVIANTSVIIE